MSRDLSAVIDIMEAARRALDFTRGMNRDDFFLDKSEQARWAVYSQIVIIGEAAARLSADFRDAHAAVPWRKVVGMRHRLVHGYDEINWLRVWETVSDDLPGLLEWLGPLRPSAPP
jgi:uncharacterized protein with HEPN domain